MQHETLPHLPQPRPVAIEVDGEPLGVVVPSGNRYRFLAVRLAAFALDGQTFETVDAARLALGQAVHPPE
jgi:hypothetical protein